MGEQGHILFIRYLQGVIYNFSNNYDILFDSEYSQNILIFKQTLKNFGNEKIILFQKAPCLKTLSKTQYQTVVVVVSIFLHYKNRK